MLLLVNCMHMCWLLCINTEAGVKMLLSAVFFVHKDVVKREARSVFFVHKDVVKREARAVFFVHKDVVKRDARAVFFVHKDVVKREARAVFFVPKDVVKREARAVFFVHKDVVKREARAVFFMHKDVVEGEAREGGLSRGFSCGDVVEREFFGIFINQNKMHCLHLSGCGVLSVLCVVVLYCVGVQCGGCSCRWGSGIWDLLWILNDV